MPQPPWARYGSFAMRKARLHHTSPQPSKVTAASGVSAAATAEAVAAEADAAAAAMAAAAIAAAVAADAAVSTYARNALI